MRNLILTQLTGLCLQTHAQRLSNEQLVNIFGNDNASLLDSLAGREHVNDCQGSYSLLAHAVRFNAVKCFDRLLEQGADVNKVCEGYIPPLMHAAKYGRLDMANALVAKGADVRYRYDGKGILPELKGMTPARYAALNNQPALQKYLEDLEASK